MVNVGDQVKVLSNYAGDAKQFVGRNVTVEAVENGKVLTEEKYTRHFSWSSRSYPLVLLPGEYEKVESTKPLKDINGREVQVGDKVVVGPRNKWGQTLKVGKVSAIRVDSYGYPTYAVDTEDTKRVGEYTSANDRSITMPVVRRQWYTRASVLVLEPSNA